MHEALAVQRSMVLPQDSAPRGLPNGLTLQILPPAARFSFRLRHFVDTPGAASFRFDQPVNRFVERDGRWSARLGPDEWLIGGPEEETARIPAEIAAAMGSIPHGLVDVSHRQIGLELIGIAAAAVLNAGCPLDLHETAFPAGAATRTLLGKAEIVLVKPSAAPLYRIECWRSFAPYVHGFLIEAAHGAGGQ